MLKLKLFFLLITTLLNTLYSQIIFKQKLTIINQSDKNALKINVAIDCNYTHIETNYFPYKYFSPPQKIPLIVNSETNSKKELEFFSDRNEIIEKICAKNEYGELIIPFNSKFTTLEDYNLKLKKELTDAFLPYEITNIISHYAYELPDITILVRVFNGNITLDLI